MQSGLAPLPLNRAQLGWKTVMGTHLSDRVMGKMQEAQLNLKFGGMTNNFLFSTCPKYRLIYVYLKFKFNGQPIFLFAKSGHTTL